MALWFISQNHTELTVLGFEAPLCPLGLGLWILLASHVSLNHTAVLPVKSTLQKQAQ
jgi:hypothetical protein